MSYGGNQSGYGQNNRYGQQAGNPYGQTGNPYAQQQSSANPYAQQQSNPYSQQQSNPYDQRQQPNPYDQRQQPNPYDQRQQPNPYDQRQQSNPYTQQQQQPNPHEQQNNNGSGRQGGNPYGQQSSNPYAQQNAQAGAYDTSHNDIELDQLNGRNTQQDEELAILDQTRDIKKALQTLQDVEIPKVQALHRQYLDSTDQDRETMMKRVESAAASVRATYSNLERRMAKLADTPGSGSERNAPTLRSLRNRIVTENQAFFKLREQHAAEIRAQLKRQMENTAQREVSEAEVQAQLDSGDTQVYAAAVKQSNRVGEGRVILDNTQGRSNGIRRIERELLELSNITMELNKLVFEQEEPVKHIDQKTQQVVEDQEQGNKQLDSGIVKARAARRKKWICLWIVVAIAVIVIAIVAGYLGHLHAIGQL